MRIWVDAVSYLPRRLRYTETGGDSTTITFRETRPNVAVGPAAFQIRLPGDVAISRSFDGLALGRPGS